MPANAVERAKETARTAQTLAQIAFFAIIITLAVNYGVMSFRAFEQHQGAPWREILDAVLRVWIPILPSALFVYALAHLGRALREYEKGEFFSPLSARAVRKAGESAFEAMIAKILIVPTILVWIDHAAPFAFHFELIDLALGAFVFFIAAIGRVLDIAAALKAENDEIV